MTEPQTVRSGGVALEFDVHDRCRKAREYAELEQSELAERIGVHHQTIGNYERRDVTHLKPLVLRQWAWACGVSYHWLRHGEAPTDPPDDESEAVARQSSAPGVSLNSVVPLARRAA